ncbi:MAG: YwqG family protein [Phenylobacterium sp.]|nr:YwqG family protein [Phenylobacterium sp.]
MFYDFEHQPWGLEASDLGTFVVRHEVGEAPLAQAPGDLHEHAQFPAYPVTYVQARSYAGWERLSVDWNSLSKQEDRELERILDEQAPAEPAHQIGGYPAPIQADGMEADCQRIVSGLFDTAKGAPQSRSGDWRLLLQVDSDDEVGFMWGDTGRIYIWVREQDARAGDFSMAWLRLQRY